MVKKNKLLLLGLLTVFVLLFLYTGYSSALEVNPDYYPDIPFVKKITESSELPDFVAYFFGLGVYLAGILAVISLAIGGIRLITSAGNPGAAGDAKERIIGAVLGLVLTVSSIIILRTINPVFIEPTLTPPGEGIGVFYTNGYENVSAPDSVSDTSNVPNGFNNLLYKCSEKGPGGGPTLLVWKFPEKNFGGYKNTSVEKVLCGGGTELDGTLSFKWSFETPGVYYFIKEGCTGFMSKANFESSRQIEEPFRSEMRSVQIINDTVNNINYGAVLHKEINLRGDCSLPFDIPTGKERGCLNKTLFPASSVDIFVSNRDNPGTSGNGLVFYSRDFGYKTGANAGYFELTQKDIKDGWIGKPNQIDFSNSYNYVNVPEGEKTLCTYFTENVKQCGGSIKIQGNYLVALYAKQLQSQNLYCQVFFKDVANLKEEEVTAVQGRELELIHIIPIK